MARDLRVQVRVVRPRWSLALAWARVRVARLLPRPLRPAGVRVLFESVYRRGFVHVRIASRFVWRRSDLKRGCILATFS